MILRTWSFELAGPLVGTGVDAEQIARFCRLSDGSETLPLVFSAQEASALRQAAAPAQAFAAAFTCKEALFKALGRPFDYTEVTLGAAPSPLTPVPQRQALHLAPALAARLEIDAEAELCLDPPDTCVAVVHVLQRHG